MPKFAGAAVWGVAAMLALAAAAAPTRAGAQNAPTPAPSADAAFDGQKAAFDALSESDRKAIQDALVWSGHYLGVVDGVFGKRTRDSIVAWQTSVKAPANGLVDAAQLAAMTAAAQKARAAVRFQTFTDDKTSVKIGAPLKLLDKRVSEASGARLMKADGSVALDLSSVAGNDANLGKLYANLTADAPGRKITLKINRPDFIVVSSEEASRKTYERWAKAPAGWPDATVIRGFRFAYPPAQSADLDRIGVAIANSFEPFPAPGPAATTAAAVPPAPPPVSRPFLAGAGLIVAPGQALSAIAQADCPNATIDGKPAKFVREDPEIGLSLISGEFGASSTFGPPRLGALGADLVALSYVADEPGGRVTLDVAPASALSPREDESRPLLLAPLPRTAGGSPVFDRTGALAAIIASSTGEPKLVAGVAPLAPHRAIDAARIKSFLSLADDAAAKADAAPLGAGRIAAAERPYVVAISCRR
jgi:peptidoglycan hydrolase-like protein with peptidoglycan-binding domain